MSTPFPGFSLQFVSKASGKIRNSMGNLEDRMLRPCYPWVIATAIALGWSVPAIAQVSTNDELLAQSDVESCDELLEQARLTGKGQCLTEQGNRYEGEFVDGQRTGTGRLTYAAGGFYEGEFVDGLFEGQGVFEAAQGHRYEGKFAGGQFNGQGTYSTADGSVYEGEFLNNTFHGEGTYTYADGRSLSGMWQQGGYMGEVPEDPTSEAPETLEASDEPEGEVNNNGANSSFSPAEEDSEENAAGGRVRPDSLAPAVGRQ
ncbi:MAG: MORN repeat-containing protein [Cyanophyceae cyanobacterium]